VETPEKAKVLIVDDDSMIRDLLKSILRHDGFGVAGEANNGEMAISMCNMMKIDIVCLDINMPKVGGIEALEVIKKAHPELIVVMISADAKMDVVQEAISKGATGFIVKPFNPGKVMDTLNHCVKLLPSLE